MELRHSVVAIIPCNDLDASQAFYERLGFRAVSVFEAQGYRILHDSHGAAIHLTGTEPGWVVPERNPFGVFFYAENVDALAESLGRTAQTKPWGVREFALPDPNGTLVRVGWPIEG